MLVIATVMTANINVLTSLKFNKFAATRTYKIIIMADLEVVQFPGLHVCVLLMFGSPVVQF